MGWGRVAAVSLVLAYTLAPERACAAEQAPIQSNAVLVTGQALTAVGAGSLSAVFTPFVICALPPMAGERSCRPLFGEEAGVATFGVTIGGALALAIGPVLWRKGARLARKRAGVPEPQLVNQAMYRTGVGLTSAGAGLGFMSMLLSHLSGLCGPGPSCGDGYRYAALGGAIGGAALAAVGIPLWIFGSEKVAAQSASPTAVKLSPAGAAAVWSF